MSIHFLVVDQRRITNTAINRIAIAKRAQGNGARFAAAPVSVIYGAGVVMVAEPVYCSSRM